MHECKLPEQWSWAGFCSLIPEHACWLVDWMLAGVEALLLCPLASHTCVITQLLFAISNAMLSPLHAALSACRLCCQPYSLATQVPTRMAASEAS